MKYLFYLFSVLIISLSYVQCSSDSDDNDSGEACIALQTELNDATSNLLDALEAYTQNPSDNNICKNYAEALSIKINSAQSLLNAGCLNEALETMTEQSIMEDQMELEGLPC